MEDLSSSMAKMMHIDGRIRRMDSTMIEANIRKLSRIGLLYTCIAKLVRYLAKNAEHIDLDGLEHYLDPADYNRVIYHSRTEDAEDRLLVLLKDADTLIERCDGAFDDVTEYQLFARCMAEQTIVEGSVRRMRTKSDGGMGSNILQNPSDPEATFRVKEDEEHHGYVANFEESVGKNGSTITSYDVETNNTSDSEMLKEHLDNMDVQSETVFLTADGAYSGINNIELAASKNVALILTELTGRDPDPFMAGFELTKDHTRVSKCPAGNKPRSCSYDNKRQRFSISFDREQCVNCPFVNQCRPKIHKHTARRTVFRKSIIRAHIRKDMQSEQYKLMARIRNGVETIPSLLKNRYHINEMPVRGKLRVKFFTGGKIGAINFKKALLFP